MRERRAAGGVHGGSGRPCGRLALCLAAGGASLLAMAPAAHGVLEGPGLQWSAAVDGQEVQQGEQIRLSPDESVTVSVSVRATGEEPVEVRSVRLDGRVLDLAFFSYRTRVDLRAEPGGSDERQYELDLEDLNTQAVGLLHGNLVLLGPDGELERASFPVDVQGSLRSVYGVFGLAVALVTVVLFWGALWSLATGRLHENRWRRGTAFAVPGLALGLTLTFSVSALGLLLPAAGTWAAFLLSGGLLGFAVGYLSPTPEREWHDDDPLVPAEEPAVAEAPATSVIDLRSLDGRDVSEHIPAPSSGPDEPVRQHRDAERWSPDAR